MRAIGAEDCDDGNLINNDGCTNTCTIEPGYVCEEDYNDTSNCSISCGDGAWAFQL